MKKARGRSTDQPRENKDYLCPAVSHVLQVSVENQIIENTNEIVYLGQIIFFESRMNKEVDRRISLGWKKFWQIKDIFKGLFRNNQKI